ncbi:hypothetical protein V1511DRAFT_513245 [Dipodascopsis uninucleata]
MLFTRGFSLTNFVIGSSALCFQTMVLYPWHEKLDEEFEDLKRVHKKTLKELEERRQQEIAEIKQQLQNIEDLHRKKRWW